MRASVSQDTVCGEGGLTAQKAETGSSLAVGRVKVV